MQHPPQVPQPQQAKADVINLEKILKLVLKKWYLFLCFIFFTLIGAFLFNEYSIPTYRTTASILIEESHGVPILETQNVFDGTLLSPGSQALENQIQILKSWSLIQRTLSGLSFEYDYYKKGFLKKASYYPMDPIEVIADKESIIPTNREYVIELDLNRNSVIASTKLGHFQRQTVEVQIGEFLVLGGGKFKVVPDPGLLQYHNGRLKFYFIRHDRDLLTQNYLKRLQVNTTGREGSVIKLSLEGTSKAKDLVFLDRLTRVFLTSNLERKNNEATRIIDFIDEQLVSVSDSLILTENRLQDFRSRNRIMDVSAQAQQIINQAIEFENEKARLTLESNYYDYLNDYLARDENTEAPLSPTTMGISDPVLERLMQELAGLQAEYFSGGVGELNPMQGQLEIRIRNTKQSIRETLQGIMRANNMAAAENDAQIRRMNNRASSLPVKERQLLGIERKFNLNNVLYTFLLQKRAEAQIQKASNMPDNELIDPARVELIPVHPNEILMYLLAVLLGLGIPFFTIVLFDSFNTRVSTAEDIGKITSLPVAGFIPHSKLSYQTVVINEPQAQIAESFRTFRARMQYFTKETRSPVILISSSVSNEGKSFVAVNLASAYSITGKKTVVVGFDLRRPNFSPDFALDRDVGISSYLIGQHNLDEIIQTTIYENLDFISSGSPPPNPAELIDSDKTNILFSELRQRYDYIIVDSAPIGTVADCYPIARIADATILIIRSGKSRRKPIEMTISDLNAIEVNGLNILVNDMKMTKGEYSYKYNYRNN